MVTYFARGHPCQQFEWPESAHSREKVLGVAAITSVKKIQLILKKFYQKNQFVKILKNDTLISTNDVCNTNNCLISVCKTKYKNKIIILSFDK